MGVVTVISKSFVVEPQELEAVTVYVAKAAATVGVPEIIPVTASRVKPVGNAGLTEYAVGAPPELGRIVIPIGVPTQ